VQRAADYSSVLSVATGNKPSTSQALLYLAGLACTPLRTRVSSCAAIRFGLVLEPLGFFLRQSSVLLAFIFSAFTVTVQAQNYSNGQAARAVLGQQNFTAGNPNSSQIILGAPSGLAFYNGTLYVADSNRSAAVPNNSRIVAFPTGQIPALRDDLTKDNLTNSDCYLCGFPASLSLGQSSWTPTDTACGQDGATACFDTQRSQSGMANATGVATDGHYFAVADTDNNRVLLWNEVPTTMNQPADIVLGQTDFTSFKTPQLVDKFSLRGPQAVWIAGNKLFVADTQNNRVLIWNTIPTQNNQAADVVLGQNDFTHNYQPPPEAANPTAAANELLNPTSVTTDPSGTKLFISDLGFNRVLIWNSIPTANAQNADVVVGQPDFVQTTANNPNVCNTHAIGPVAECRTSLNFPRFALSNGTKLFVADGGNDRVLIWDTIPTTNGALATGVLGQPDFIQDVVSSAAISIASTAIDNTGGVDLVPTPQGLAYDPATQNLYVSDADNRRVVVYTPGDNPLPTNSVVNWASEIVRQEGTITIGGTVVTGDTISVTIGGGTAYTYTVVKADTLDTIAQAVVALINGGSGDPYATAIFSGVGTGSIYLSSKGTDLGYDTLSLTATSSNTADEVVTTSGAYLSAGTAATGAVGMIVEINGANLSDQTAAATLDGTSIIPSTLGGVQVFMDGYPCPIFKASPTQIITQIPYNYADRNSTSVYVRTEHSDGTVTVTTATPVYIASANPGIFNAPAFAGQPRPWPITMAYHQPGNPTAVLSIDGSVTAANTATVTIAGSAYTYTVVAADTLLTITQNLINLINASDPNVTASIGGAFDRIVLTAKQPGAAGNGITVAGSTSTGATVTVTAYSSATCCVVTPGSLISTANPAAPGELITVTGVGLGDITDLNGNSISTLGTGVPYAGLVPNTAYAFVTATMGGTTAQTIFAELPQNSYGIFNIQMVVPTSLATNSATTLDVAQNAFISNIVTLPVGPAVLYTPPTPSAPPTTIAEVIDAPAAGQTVSGTIAAAGWALNSTARVSGVNVSIDGVLYGQAVYGLLRNDVCASYSSPDCPNPGWYLLLDTTQFADGQHTISITALSTTNYTISQTFYVANSATVAASEHAFIDVPGPNFSYRGVTAFGGWATNDNSVVAGVSIYVDGVAQGAASYGTPRPDVCAAYPHSPSCNGADVVGWYFPFDTTKLASGQHTLVAKSVSVNGQTYATSTTFQVANWTGAGTTKAVIDSPSAGAGAFSGNLSAFGWAIDQNSAVTSVDIAVDGVTFGSALYGTQRTDVCAAFSNASCPNVGFLTNIDTTSLADGQHTLTVTVNLARGQSSTYTRTFSVANLGSSSNPVDAFIDTPTSSTAASGIFSATGWGLSTAAGDSVTSVALLVDGKSFGNAAYGGARPDVCASYAGAGCPNVGWSASLNTGLLGNGMHNLEATVTTANGHRASAGTTFLVSNPTTGPAHIFFDTPKANASFLGTALFAGWAVNTSTRVESLSVTVDGVPYGAATYSIARPDVCAIYTTAPNCIAGNTVGWSFGLDTTQLADGAHSIGITENNLDGSVSTSSTPFTVANYSTSNPTLIFVENPVNTTAYNIFGTITVSGWAINNNSAIASMKIAIDGVPAGQAAYGASRPDVCLAYPGAQGCPNVGWFFIYDTTLIANGIHSLDITATTVSGEVSTVSQQFSVAN
jgi:uncharacterized protein (TIGR03437 family)